MKEEIKKNRITVPRLVYQQCQINRVQVSSKLYGAHVRIERLIIGSNRAIEKALSYSDAHTRFFFFLLNTVALWTQPFQRVEMNMYGCSRKQIKKRKKRRYLRHKTGNTFTQGHDKRHLPDGHITHSIKKAPRQKKKQLKKNGTKWS